MTQNEMNERLEAMQQDAMNGAANFPMKPIEPKVGERFMMLNQSDSLGRMDFRCRRPLMMEITSVTETWIGTQRVNITDGRQSATVAGASGFMVEWWNRVSANGCTLPIADVRTKQQQVADRKREREVAKLEKGIAKRVREIVRIEKDYARDVKEGWANAEQLANLRRWADEQIADAKRWIDRMNAKLDAIQA